MNSKPKRIVVVGSSNTDMVIRTNRMPRPGETVLGGNFMMNQGGKGANQAVAAAKLGGDTTFVAKVGDDIFGRQTVELLRKVGIDTTYVGVSANCPSGVALINVDASGENSIASGRRQAAGTVSVPYSRRYTHVACVTSPSARRKASTSSGVRSSAPSVQA